MAGDDSGGVDEQLNGLVTLLKSVGIDGVDPGLLADGQNRSSRSSNKKGAGKNKTTANNNSATSDAQILEIIKKLQQAQSDSPEIMEALKNPQLLALASLAAQKQITQTKTSSSKRSKTKSKKSVTPTLDDVIDDDDNYPKIGPGYSDEVSCISEISTPTVMTSQKVADEEHYRELKGPGAMTPMHLLGAERSGKGTRLSKISETETTPESSRPGLGTSQAGGKVKNMLGQVRPLPSRRAIPTKSGGSVGGAAAQRRLNYQMAMSKLESSGFGQQTAPTSSIRSESSSNSNNSNEKKSKKPAGLTTGTRSDESGSGSGRRKPRDSSSKSKKDIADIDWGMTEGNGWPTLEEEGEKSKSRRDLVVDNDGFLSEIRALAKDKSVAVKKSRRKKPERSETSPSRRTGDGSSGSRSKKKSSRENGESSSSRKSHRVKKPKEGSSTKRRSKSTGKYTSSRRRQNRRPSLR